MAGAANPTTAAPTSRMGTAPVVATPQPFAQPMIQPVPAQPNVYQQSADAYTNALQGTQSAMSYQPQQITSQSVGTQFGYAPEQVASQAAYGGMANYANPYTQQVINTSMADLERQRQIQMGGLGAQASAARAFGGSRQGVAEAQTNEGFARQGGQLSSQLYNQGFQTALGASQQDVASRLQAAMANQSATGRAQEFGQQQRLQADLANQQAAMQAQIASQQNALQAAQQSMQGANQLGNLSGLGFGFGQTIGGQQSAEGQRLQDMNQALIDAAKVQYGGFTGAPTDALSTYLAALGGSQTGQQTQTSTQNPGLLQYLSLGLGLL